MLKLYTCIFFFSISSFALLAQDPQMPVPASLNISKDSLSHFLKMNIDTIKNPLLYATVVEWIGTRYRYGGRSKKGIDCSDFTSILYKNAFAIDLEGSAGDFFKKTSPIPKASLQEGDMVFFKIRRRKISHVGVYLCDNKFAHATTRAGVVISDLSEPYYKKFFYKAGTIAKK
jgi:lipoprotein Spr